MPWAGVVMVAAWCHTPHAFWLAGAAVALGLGTVAMRDGRVGRAAGLGHVILLASVVFGFWLHGRDRALARDFDTYWADREARVFDLLDAELSNMLDRGTDAATTLAAAAGGGNPPPPATVARLRREAGLTALALYDSLGTLLVWDGAHRGRVPEAVQRGQRTYLYAERPLVGHLYVTAPAPGGRTAVAAALLRADLPTAERRGQDFASTVRARTGEEIRVSSASRAADGEIFDLRWQDMTLVSVSLDRPSPTVRRAALFDRGRQWVTLMLALAWGMFAVGSAGRVRAIAGALVTLFALAALMPVQALPGLALIASPADVLLRGPGDATLARLLLLLGAMVVTVGAARPTAWPGGRLTLGAALVGVGFPLVAWALHSGASAGFLAGGEGAWLIYTGVLAGYLSLVAWLALVLARRAGQRRFRGVLGVGLAVVLALTSTWVVMHLPGPHAGLLVLWVIPLAVLTVVGPRAERWSGALAWGVALTLGLTAALPQAWGARLAALQAQAEAEVGRLGTGVDPYLQFLLERAADRLTALDDAGVSSVELLYRSWRESGLADEGYPVWLTLWSAGGRPQEELRVGFGSRDRPMVADRFLDDARAGDSIQVQRFEQADAHYLMLAPLAGARVVSAVVPPLEGTLRGVSLLGALLGGSRAALDDPLTLIPLLPNEELTRGEQMRWVRAPGAWLGELALIYPGDAYHAHYEIRLPSWPVLVARGALFLALAGLVFWILWAGGRLLGGGEAGVGGLVRLTVASFRARVTLALFGFFVLSNLLLGGLAYRTIAGASQRAARVLAERAVDDAAATYLDMQGQITLLARRVGADLLGYRAGELREASIDELVELGLYEGWIPHHVYRALAERESLIEVADTRLGPWEYVTAYGRLPDGDMLAAPVPLQVGAAAVQSRELAHLLGFAGLAGAGGSLLLALLVGRMLARPIQTLKIASERVGAGNLGVRLHDRRPDEFGAVFDAFNRMVRRLRRARKDLVRVTRRTQAVVDDVATGVVAFDAQGVVTLVNPRAQTLLGLPLREGQRPDPGEGVGDEFVRWVGLYFRDGLDEASTEFQVGPRRLRARARRIGRGGGLGGAVVSLEDVTDELRTERVLAWGEMARQVAHEVKNPLTPIKLSVQHIRRAWQDRRPDFDDILERNADAMLREIDRLAGIASSFARFGAPAAGGDIPLEPVDLPLVVREVLALYAAGEGPVRFVDRVPAALPPVTARAQELKEVLVNLLENARGALRDEGTVVVDVLDHGAGGGDGSAGRGGAGEWVVLRVVDDGVGIGPAALPRIFEPHFSTRSSGTGLGLAIVQRLVEGWGGAVTAESSPGERTVLSLHLPVWTGEAEPGALGGGVHDGPI
jgi:signal transduction histidine kinase/HAMP domain-containing protein